METGTVQLDLSKAQPIGQPAAAPPPAPPAGSPAGGGVQLDMSKAQPIQLDMSKAQPIGQPTGGNPLTANPKNEGIYQMLGPDGKPAGIPYSNAQGPAIRSGYKFASDQEAARFAHDYAADPRVISGASDLIRDNPGTMTALGAAHGAAKTAAGLGEITHAPVPKGVKDFADAPNEGGYMATGDAAEGMAEYLTGEEALSLLGKVAKGSEALKAATHLTQLAEKFPVLGRALKNAVIAGGQTFAKTGGDVGASAQAAALAGGISGTIEKAGQGIAGAIEKRAATTETVGGVETTVPAELRTAKETPQQTAGKQSIKNAAKDSLGRNLQEVNESRSIPGGPKLTTGSDPYEFKLKTTPARTTPATTTRTGPAVVPAGKGTVTGELHAKPQYVTSAERIPTKPGNENAMAADVSTTQPRPVSEDVVTPSTAEGGGILKTQDPNVAREHIATLNEAIENHPTKTGHDFQDLNTAREDAQQQMGEYHEQLRTRYPGSQRPNFEQIDIPKTTEKIGSFTEAADHLEKTATDGYQHFNDLTGGKFNAIREENSQAWAAYKGASGAEAQDAAEKAIDASNAKMTDLMKSIGGAITPKELSGFNDAYKNAQTLRAVANAVDGSFSGNSSNAARSWEYRGFDGNRLMANLSRLQQKQGRPALERVIGKQNLDTLFQVAELNRSNAARGRFGQAIKPIADWLQQSGGAIKHIAPIAIGGEIGRMTGMGWAAGAVAGELTGMATKKVMNAILTNPKVAQNLIFAIQSGANPKNYAPLIGTMIQQAETENSRSEKGDQDGK
jgi:hypothetical protein